MDTISVRDLREDLSFTGDLLIDSSFLLLPKTADLTADMLKQLRRWEFDTVLCDGGLSLGGDIGITAIDENDNESEKPKEKFGNNIKKVLEISKSTQIGNSDQARMEMVQQVYDEYMNYIEQVFTHYATHKEIDQNEIQETVKELCIFIKEHRRYILRINPTIEDTKKNFLVIHTMRTTVLAIAIALQLHIPLSKMIELGVTCILHEIGMLRLPPQLYMTSKKLTQNEKAQIAKHTVFGYTIVKDLNFGLPIQLGVLEHHEKENGSGYPRHLTSEKISSNAKIIAVACTYEAISSPRSYKDERSTFDALIELIQNKAQLYDSTVLKALLYTVSLYPIGTYVYLTNRKVAEVVDSNPENPKCPLVQLLTEKDSDGSLKIIPTGQNGISILRILSRQEKEDILKAIDIQEHGKPIELEPLDDDDVELSPLQENTAPAAPVTPASQIQKPASAPRPMQTPAANQATPQMQMQTPTANQTTPQMQIQTPTANQSPRPAQAQTSPSPAPAEQTTSAPSDTGMESVDINDFI